MPVLFILGFTYVLPAYRDMMKLEGPKHIHIFYDHSYKTAMTSLNIYHYADNA